MIEQYKQKICLRSRIIMDDLDRIYRTFQRRESVYTFFDTLFELLKEDSFLALDPTLIEKITKLCTLFLFRFPKDYDLRIRRRIVLRELKRQKRCIQAHREEIVRNLIEKERYERRIPFECVIGEKELLEMYKQDFNNFLAIHYPDVCVSSLFYFLTTVHKVYNSYPEYIHDNTRTISFVMMRMQSSFLKKNILKNYIQNTEFCIYEDSKVEIMPQKKKTITSSKFY